MTYHRDFAFGIAALLVSGAAACGGDTAVPPGPDSPSGGWTSRIDVTAHGAPVPPGVTIQLGDQTRPVVSGQPVLFEFLPDGTYTLSVAGLPTGCTVIGESSRSQTFQTSGPAAPGSTLREAANGWYESSYPGVGLHEVVDLSCTGVVPRDLVLTASARLHSETADLIVATRDGAALRNISGAAPTADAQPVWSPDGTAIAFFRVSGGQFSLIVMLPDGTGGRTITVGTNATYGVPPSELHWSPDGSTLIYWSGVGGLLHLVPVDGSAERTIALPHGALAPDELHYAFADAAGVHVTTLATGTSVLVGPGRGIPAWSPDGARIAFGTGTADGCTPGDIFVANADGTGLVDVTATPAVHEYGPVWGPDGRRLAFGYWSGCTSSQPRGYLGVGAPGTAPREVASDVVNGGRFAWSPDGNRLAFSAAVGGGCGREAGCLAEDLHVVRLDVAQEYRVTTGVFAENPQWSPSP